MEAERKARRKRRKSTRSVAFRSRALSEKQQTWRRRKKKPLFWRNSENLRGDGGRTAGIAEGRNSAAPAETAGKSIRCDFFDRRKTYRKIIGKPEKPRWKNWYRRRNRLSQEQKLRLQMQQLKTAQEKAKAEAVIRTRAERARLKAEEKQRHKEEVRKHRLEKVARKRAGIKAREPEKQRSATNRRRDVLRMRKLVWKNRARPTLRSAAADIVKCSGCTDQDEGEQSTSYLILLRDLLGDQEQGGKTGFDGSRNRRRWRKNVRRREAKCQSGRSSAVDPEEGCV